MTEPDATTCVPTIARMSVDLPLPLGPRRPVTVPRRTSSVIRSSASRPPRTTWRRSTSTARSAGIGLFYRRRPGASEVSCRMPRVPRLHLESPQGAREAAVPDKRPSVKNETQYEASKDKGVSKERAARIARSPGASSRGGKRSGSGGDAAPWRHHRAEEGGGPQGRQSDHARALVGGSDCAASDLVGRDLLRARQRAGSDVQRDRRAGRPLPPAPRERRLADRIREGVQGGAQARPGRRDRPGLRGVRG